MALEAKGYFRGADVGSEEHARRTDLAWTKFRRRRETVAQRNAGTDTSPGPPAGADLPATADGQSPDERRREASRLASSDPPSTPQPESRESLVTAEALLVSALEAAPGSTGLDAADTARTQLLLATTRLDLGDIPGAVRAARAGVAVAPTQAVRMKCLAKLGHALERSGDLEGAIREGYGAALEIDPANTVMARYRDGVLEKLHAASRPTASAAGADTEDMMADPEVVGLASQMAEKIISDPAMMAQMAALFPGGVSEDMSDEALQRLADSEGVRQLMEQVSGDRKQ